MTDRDMTDAIPTYEETVQLLLADLQRQLDAELEKPDDELDVDAINRITLSIDRLTGSEQDTAAQAQTGISALKKEMRQRKSKQNIRVFRRIAACACIALVLTNIWTYSAYGMNSFSAAYQFFRGGVTIDLQNDDDSVSFEGNPYLEDMRQACKQYRIDEDVLLPAYIPGGFVEEDDFYEGSDGEDFKQVLLYFRKGKIKMCLEIMQFTDEKYVENAGIPSTEYNFSRQKFGDVTVHISKETKDRQWWAVFQIGLTRHVIYTEGLDYDECQRILDSMFDTN